MMFYTGIGSRKTPKDIASQMTSIAAQLAELGFHLRSGKADGADTAFQKGAMSANGNMTIYVPDNKFGSDRISETKDDYVVDGDLLTWAQDYTKTVHSDWDAVSHYGKKLQGRNACQVLGHNPKQIVLSKFVLYWAPVNKKGQVLGGTATAVKLAKKFNIPTINMLDSNWRWDLTRVLNSYLHQEVEV